MSGSNTDPTPEELLQLRAEQIYQLAYERMAGMLAMYQIRKLNPDSHVQALPDYLNAAEYEFFKPINGDGAVFELTFPEYKAYLVALEKLIAEHGYKSHRVMITQAEFQKYLADMESAQ